MNILYHLTILPPKFPEREALSQEITALCHHLGGELNYINPNQTSPIYVPRLLFGFHQFKQLRAREARHVQIHHFYNPDPYPFPVLRWLKRPVIYSVSSGVGPKRPNVKFFKSMAVVAVADERSLKRLRDWGVNNTRLVRSGIDTARFTHTPVPLGPDIRLMVGSAPWAKAQFRTKGVDALLEAARQDSRLHLVFLWRGVLTAEVERRVDQLNLNRQVTVLDGRVDVNEVLATVHASITLASCAGLVKSYPHSLLESLAAGKPVLVSRAIPMADYVAETGCGHVVENVTPEAIFTAIEVLRREYVALQESARAVGHRDFSQQAMIASYQDVYEHSLATGKVG